MKNAIKEKISTMEAVSSKIMENCGGMWEKNRGFSEYVRHKTINEEISHLKLILHSDRVSNMVSNIVIFIVLSVTFSTGIYLEILNTPSAFLAIMTLAVSSFIKWFIKEL